MKFLGKKLAPHTGPFIVAEISCNHEGSLDQAYKLIQAAKDAGADAVKIQVYTPDEMTINHRSYIGPQNNYEIQNEFFCATGPWKDRHLYELYVKNQTPLEWVPLLFLHAAYVQIPMFASVFGEQSLVALEEINCPAYKIASFEANYVPFIKKVQLKGKPVIVSTGCIEFDEFTKTYTGLIPMHCVSEYPTSFDKASLSRIMTMRRMFGDPVGFSDHSVDRNAAICAVTLGASIIEKHLCLDVNTSDDAAFSLSPLEFQKFRIDCQLAVAAYKDTINTSNQYKRSIYVVSDIKEGEQFTEQNIRCIRPGYGLEPKHYERVLTFTATRDINRGEALVTDMVKWNSKLP